MKVAIISSANGGVGSFTFNLARALGRQVDQLDLYLYADSSRNVPIGEMPENVSIGICSNGRIRFVAEMLASTGDLLEYDVVHNIVLSPYALLLEAIPTHDVKLVNTVHPQPVLSSTEFSVSALINQLYQRAEKFTQQYVSKIADITVTVSEDSAALVRERWGVDPEVVYHGVDDKQFSPDVDGTAALREELGVATDEVLFLFVGILYPKKDVGTLIDAIPQILADHKSKFLIIGRGDEAKTLHRKVAEYGLEDHVIHEEYVEDIETYYAASDVFVMPSFIEEFGIVYVEAMQSGLPVIAADIDVAREVLGDAGLYFEPGDPDDLAETAGMLLEDDERWQALVEQGIDRADRFDWETAASEYREIYETASRQR